MVDIDLMQMNFDVKDLFFMKLTLAFIMFGVALDISPASLKEILKKPKSLLVGLGAQFLLLPAMTFLLISIFEPRASIALGMIIVAACPGGNISNLITYLSKGNTALSVGMTFMATALAIVMTPLNITFWGNLYEPSQKLVQQVALNTNEVMMTIVFVLGIPLVLGVFIRKKYSVFADKVEKVIKVFSILFLGGFIAGALIMNYENFIKHIGSVVFIVFLHNFIAIFSGYSLGTIFKVGEKNRKSITIEVGIQNSGLALALIFEFFNGLGGVAIIAAWWGVWHILSGGVLAFFWSGKYKSLISGKRTQLT